LSRTPIAFDDNPNVQQCWNIRRNSHATVQQKHITSAITITGFPLRCSASIL